MKPTVYTIGHSNRTLADFLRLLKAHGVEQVLDVRAIPQSRHNQQFARLDLARALRARSSGYRWVPKLGGRRHATKDSPNSGWRNAAFRSDADYMATASFAQGLNIAEDVAASKPTALMCAEAVPWRCHRSLIADALTKKKWIVRHITGLGATRIHRPTPFLRVRRGMLLYPP
jgi:uncharacterized protein (DUF488 family)